MEVLTIAEINLLTILMSTVKNGESKYTLKEIVESPFFESSLNKFRNEMIRYEKENSIDNSKNSDLRNLLGIE